MLTGEPKRCKNKAMTDSSKGLKDIQREREKKTRDENKKASEEDLKMKTWQRDRRKRSALSV